MLIDFWAYSCINCQRSIPHVVAWDETYRDAGLNVIGIHSPEYAFEKDAGNVKAGAEDFGIEYPVALDNTLWSGAIADPRANDANTVALRELNDALAARDDVDVLVLTIGDGVTLVRPHA